MKQELKEIPIDKIYANASQPREEFDKEQIQELAESILSNGLINPIIVRESDNGKFMIVAGERRWRAHKVAGLKTIQSFVREYKDDGQWMIESFIENLHRTDLTPVEKAKYLKRIMDTQKLDVKGLSDLLKISETSIQDQLSLLKDKEIMEFVQKGVLPSAAAQSILQMADKDTAKQLAKKAVKNEMGRTELRETIKVLNKSAPEVKKALLDDEIDVKQAESISRLKKPEQIKKAIQDHKTIKKVGERIEKNIEAVDKIRDKKTFNKQLLQAGNWITSFRGSVTDSSRSIEKTIKVLLVSTKFVPMMDDKQKDQLNQQLDRFLEILEKAERLSEQIQERTE